MNGPSPAPAPEPTPPEEPQVVEDAPAAPDGEPVAPEGPPTPEVVDPAAQAAAAAAQAEEGAKAEADLAEALYEDQIAAVAVLKEGNKIPAEIEVAEADMEALKDRGITTAELLNSFFESTPTVDKVKEENPNLEISKMSLKDWMDFLSPKEAEVEESKEEGGFMSGLGAAFGKIGEMLKKFFETIKGFFAGLFGGKDKTESSEVTAKMQEIETDLMEGSKSLLDSKHILPSMSLDNMDARSLFNMGLSSAEALKAFVESKGKVADVIIQSPDNKDEIESMSLLEYVMFLRDLPEESEGKEPEDEEPAEEPDEEDAEEQPDAAGTGGARDSGDTDESEVPPPAEEVESEQKPDSPFSYVPDKNVDMEHGEAFMIRLKTGEMLTISSEYIKVDRSKFKVQAKSVINVFFNRVDVTDGGFNLNFSAKGRAGDFPLDSDKMVTFIKSLHKTVKNNAGKNVFDYPIPAAILPPDSPVDKFQLTKIT